MHARNLNRRDGFILPAGLFALIVMAILMVAALRLSDDERRSTRALRESGVALYDAESGLNRTLGAWPTSGVIVLAPGDSLDLGWATLSNGAKYRTVIHRVDAGATTRLFAVMVQAVGAGGLGGRSSVTTVVRGTFTPLNGLVSLGDIQVNGSGLRADSYNSIVGPYNPAASDSNVSLVANGDVTLTNQGVLYGNIDAGGTAKYGAGNVTGTVTENDGTPVPAGAYPTPPCPTPNSVWTPASDVPKIAGVNYDDKTGDLRITSGAQLTLNDTPTGGRYYFNSITLNGGASTINFAYGTPPQKITVYIYDFLSMSAQTFMNNLSSDPKLLTISSCLDASGGPKKPGGFTVNGGSGAYFSVYAPNQFVKIAGSGDIWGAVVGSGIDVTGSGQFHFDEALGKGGGSFVMVSGAWAMMQPF
jgi:hypothetical protein